MGLERRLGAVERVGRDRLHLGLVGVARQPGGDLFVFGIVDRGVQNPVQGRRRHAAVAQHGRGLVGRRQHGEGAAGSLLAPLPFGGDHLHPRVLQRLDQTCEQQRLAGPGLAEHGHGLAVLLGQRLGFRQRPGHEVDAMMRKASGHRVEGGKLVVGQVGDRRRLGHGVSGSHGRRGAGGSEV